MAIRTGGVIGLVLWAMATGLVSGAASAAGKITYLKEMSWSQKNLLIGKNGIAALTFCNVPILPR